MRRLVPLWALLGALAGCGGAARMPVEAAEPAAAAPMPVPVPSGSVWATSARASSSYGRVKWNATQALGAPNTRKCGDFSTAWASKTKDGRDEWLEVGFAEAAWSIGVRVYETYNPGAIRRVEAREADGRWVTVWRGTDPNRACPGVAHLDFSRPVRTDRVRLHLASRKVSGWNEIDAVALELGQADNENE